MKWANEYYLFATLLGDVVWDLTSTYKFITIKNCIMSPHKNTGELCNGE